MKSQVKIFDLKKYQRRRFQEDNVIQLEILAMDDKDMLGISKWSVA